MSELTLLANNPDGRASKVKECVLANEGKFSGVETTPQGISSETISSNIKTDLKASFQMLDSLRKGDPTKKRASVDIDFAAFVKARWGFGSLDSFYSAIGIEKSSTTVESLMTVPDFDDNFRWLVPEIFRDAIQLGLRKAPIYPNLIAAEETISQPSVIMPNIHMSEATPKLIGEAESIPMGTMRFSDKTVRTVKLGKGIELSDEVLQFVNLNVLSLFLQDVGLKLGQGLDTLAVTTLINGEQAGLAENAPVIGTTTINTFAYQDFLRAWIRMSRLGKTPGGILSGENAAIDVLMVPEFKGFDGTARTTRINLQTPVPQSQNHWVHGAMPANMAMLIDPSMAMIKLNSMALRVESDRIVNKQLNGTFVSLMTGFAIIYRDARMIIDKSQAFTSFPSYMNVDAAENVVFQ